MKSNIELNHLLDYIKKDKEIKKIYEEVEIYELNNNARAFHNYNHITNVTETATNILKELNYDEDTITSCKIACLLHDTGVRFGKENHEIRSYEFAKEYFDDHNWNFKNKELIIDAIKNHSNGFDSDNIITLALILADKLDIKKNRITKEGKKVAGNRQYSHIEDIKINIKGNTFIVNFISDGKIDINELNEYYFTKKVYNSIKSFSNKNNLKYNILIDNKPILNI